MRTKTLLVAAVILLMAALPALPALAHVPDPDAEWEKKVDTELLLLARRDPAIVQQMAEIEADIPDGLPIIIEFDGPPDTSMCASLPTEKTRKDCVIGILKPAAEKAQAETRAALERQGIQIVEAAEAASGPRMETIWISNRLILRGVDVTPMLLATAATRTEVTRLRLGSIIPLEETTGEPIPRGELDPWHLATTGLLQACQETGACGQGVTVGLIDTGVDWGHPDLQHLDPCRGTGDYSRCWVDIVSRRKEPYDLPTHPHGTHVAGIIGGKNTGGALMVWLVVARTFATWGADAPMLEAAAQWMLEQGEVDVVNNSWGNENPGVRDYFRPSLQAWRNAGIIPVFSAGNSGAEGCESGRSPGNLAETRLSVAAVDRSGKRAYFSSIGPSADTDEPRPSIAAGGLGVHSTVPFEYDPYGYQSWNGTSMAAPNITAMVAQVLSAGQPPEIDEIEDGILMASTPKADETGCWSSVIDGHPVNSDYGFGLLNAVAVAEALGPWPSGRVIGRIIDADTGLPLGEAVWGKVEMGLPNGTPQLFSRRSPADADGRFSITLLPGTYILRATAFGYAVPEPVQIDVVDGGEVEINFALTRLPHYRVRGTAFADEHPQGEVEVFAEETPATTSTAWGSGSWELMLPAATYTIIGRCDQCLNGSETITVTGNTDGVELYLWHISSYKATGGATPIEDPPADAQQICGEDGGCNLYNEVTIPWDFPYWESEGITATVRTLYVTGYGYITTADATAGEAAESKPALGDGVAPNGLIAPALMDGLPNAVWLWMKDDAVHVLWEGAKHSFAATRWDFEAILYQNGEIEFRYGGELRYIPGYFGLEDAEGKRVATSGYYPNPGVSTTWRMWRSNCVRYRIYLPLVLAIR